MRLLILGSSYEKRNKNLSNAATYAISKGHEVISINGFRYEKDWKGKSDFTFYKDFNTFIQFAINMQVDKVVCLSVHDTLDRDAEIKDILELNGIEVIANSKQVIETFKSKINTRGLLEKLQIKMARGKCIEKNSNREIFELCIREIGMPVVIKETDSTGGLGITYINNEESLNFFLEHYNNTIGYVVEEFIEGIELSMEVVCYKENYICNPFIYKGFTKNGSHSLDNIRISPFNNNKATNQAKSIAKRIIEEINPTGIFEIDLLWNPDEEMLFVFEINPRMGGVSKIDMESTGVSIPNAFIDMADKSWKPKEFIHNGEITLELPLRGGLTEDEINKLAKNLKTFRWAIQRPRMSSAGMVCFSGTRNGLINDLTIFSPNLIHSLEHIKSTVIEYSI